MVVRTAPTLCRRCAVAGVCRHRAELPPAFGRTGAATPAQVSSVCRLAPRVVERAHLIDPKSRQQTKSGSAERLQLHRLHQAVQTRLLWQGRTEKREARANFSAHAASLEAGRACTESRPPLIMLYLGIVQPSQGRGSNGSVHRPHQQSMVQLGLESAKEPVTWAPHSCHRSHKRDVY